MKRNLVIIIFLFLSSNLFAQNVAHEELMLFMTQHPDYVSFQDPQLLDTKVKDYYAHVKEFLDSKNEKIEDYYVKTDMIFEKLIQGGDITDGSTLSFPIFHIDTFRALLKLKKENLTKYNELNTGKNSAYPIVGNASGKDGWMEINYSTKLVKFTLAE